MSGDEGWLGGPVVGEYGAGRWRGGWEADGWWEGSSGAFSTEASSREGDGELARRARARTVPRMMRTRMASSM
jgi:hypothetical protein